MYLADPSRPAPVDVPTAHRARLASCLGWEPDRLFAHGNLRLLGHDRLTLPETVTRDVLLPNELDLLETEADRLVLDGHALVVPLGCWGSERLGAVPLRWGSPRVLVCPDSLEAALGDELKEEPFRVWSLWRYRFDPLTDLALAPRHRGEGRALSREAHVELARAVARLSPS